MCCYSHAVLRSSRLAPRRDVGRCSSERAMALGRRCLPRPGGSVRGHLRLGGGTLNRRGWRPLRNKGETTSTETTPSKVRLDPLGGENRAESRTTRCVILLGFQTGSRDSPGPSGGPSRGRGPPRPRPWPWQRRRWGRGTCFHSPSPFLFVIF